MMRILVTGSRDWGNRAMIEEALSPYRDRENAILVSGACPSGADAIAEEIWEGWGLPVERHPADWKRYGKMAGRRRNQEMVDLGAYECLAFRRYYSPGTTHCANAAHMAGIPVTWYTLDEE